MLTWLRRKLWDWRPYRCRTCRFATHWASAARAHVRTGHNIVHWSASSYRELKEA